MIPHGVVLLHYLNLQLKPRSGIWLLIYVIIAFHGDLSHDFKHGLLSSRNNCSRLIPSPLDPQFDLTIQGGNIKFDV